MRSVVDVLDVNVPLPADQFDLVPPPGAAVSDYTTTPTTRSIQLADGTRRVLEPHELGPENLLRLSAGVKGSRVEGQAPPPPPPPPGPVRQAWPMLLLINGVFAILLLVYIVRRRRTPGPETPSTQP